ncbi:hypothetical protein BRADI_1g59978v3 [Brachypodium distachyon]|uniref:Uncharacterized protein n=1 Tax=Brachypodium distachyon TaxID=15368 RepID=A0A0Q3HEW9_BRADI|nr:hypothetical protein BRADI_1g59978v3 [Brachypodium distachyon]
MAKDKGKKSGEDDIKKSLDAICNARKDYVEERKLMKTKEMEERSAAKVREEGVGGGEEDGFENTMRLMEKEKVFMFMDTSNLSEKQKEYVELMRGQVLSQKRMIGGYMMNGFVDGMGTMGGIGCTLGFMGAIGGTMGAMGGIGSMGGIEGTMGGIGGFKVA